MSSSGDGEPLSCRKILGLILDLIPYGFKIQNIEGTQINPASDDTLKKEFPTEYFSEKITDASTNNVNIVPGFFITKITLINLGTVEITFALGIETGNVGTDITLPVGEKLTLNHSGVEFISYKGEDTGGEFLYIVQGL